MPGCCDKKSDCGRLPTCSDVLESTGCNECHGRQEGIPYREVCPVSFCDYYCKGMSAQEIMVKYGDAVMEGHAEFQLTTSTVNTDNPLVDINYDDGTLETVYTHFNCTFIDQHVIIAPASKVFLPPNSTLAYNQYPYGASMFNAAGFNPDAETRANRIFVDVTNVNGSDHSYTYQVDIIGAYLLGDLAILYIDAEAQWNANIPCIKRCHSHIRLACSRRYRRGLNAFVIGHDQVVNSGACVQGGSVGQSSLQFFSAEKSIAKTLIHSTRGLDRSGVAPQELVLLQGNVGNKLVGAPILNAYGHMIGYLTLNGVQGNTDPALTVKSLSANTTPMNAPYDSGSLVGGPSSFFFIDILRVLLCSLSSKNSDFVETATSLVGDYIRYVHGGLGLAYQVWRGSMYMSSTNAVSGQPETRFVVGTTTGEYAIPEYRKENVGVRVFGLTVDQGPAPRFNNSVFLPGQLFNSLFPAAVTPWVDTALNLAINDQIVFFEGCPLGDQNSNCIAPLLMLSRMKVGDTLLLKARTAVSDYQTEVTQSVTLKRLPLFFNYPLASYASFPWTNLASYNVSFAGTFPEDPSVQGTYPINTSAAVSTISVV